MKYSPEMTKKICDLLASGYLRIEAVKAVGISYETFTVWLEKTEFSELIKKAEERGLETIESMQLKKILENESWQSAAWFLERRLSHKYALNKPEIKEDEQQKHTGGHFNIEKIEIVHTTKKD
jgi:hypothetical protein